MGNELLRIFSEELRETKRLVVKTCRMADAAMERADEAIITNRGDDKTSRCGHEERRCCMGVSRHDPQSDQRGMTYMKLPWWRKVFGQAIILNGHR